MLRFKHFALLLCLIILVMPVAAIGEVTPTPTPEIGEEPPDDIDVDALIEEGLEDIQGGEFRSALAKMDVVIEADPNIATAYSIRGIAESQLGMIQDAIDDFSSAIELAPWRFDLYIFRGDVHLANSSLIDALLDFDEAIRISPFAADGYLRRSNVHFELDEDSAGDVDDLTARAMSAYANREFPEAIVFLDEAIAIGEDLESLGMVYYLRGIANLNLGDTDTALEDYATALEIDPDIHNVYLARGILYSQRGNLKAAGQDFYNRITILGNETIEEEMSIGETVEYEMAYRRVIEVRFEAEAGQVVTISATEIGDTFVDPLITVLDPDGDAIAGDDDSGENFGSRLTDLELPEDGTYTLMISHAEGGRVFGFMGMIEVEISE